jgi:predicted Fe-Mo cluster-binding NifX family protein
MKIAFTSKGTDWGAMMDPRFGRTDYLLVYDEASGELDSYDNRSIENEAHGAGPKTAQKLAEFQADVLITGNGPGGNAARVLKETGISMYTGAGSLTVGEALQAFKKGTLNQF